jgi:hypothetical protein
MKETSLWKLFDGRRRKSTEEAHGTAGAGYVVL